MPIKLSPKQDHSDATTKAIRKLLDDSMRTVDNEIRDYETKLRNESYLSQETKNGLKQQKCAHCDGVQLAKNKACELYGIELKN